MDTERIADRIAKDVKGGYLNLPSRGELTPEDFKEKVQFVRNVIDSKFVRANSGIFFAIQNLLREGDITAANLKEDCVSLSKLALDNEQNTYCELAARAVQELFRALVATQNAVEKGIVQADKAVGLLTRAEKAR